MFLLAFVFRVISVDGMMTQLELRFEQPFRNQVSLRRTKVARPEMHQQDPFAASLGHPSWLKMVHAQISLDDIEILLKRGSGGDQGQNKIL